MLPSKMNAGYTTTLPDFIGMAKFPCPPGVQQNISHFFEQYLDRGKKLTYKSGDKIYYPQNSRKFFYVTKGLLGFYFGESEYINNFTGEGSLHFEIYYFIPIIQNVYHICLKDTELYEFSFDFLEELENKDPHVMHSICEGVCIKLVFLSLIIQLINTPSLPKRLAKYLIYLYEYYGTLNIKCILTQNLIGLLLRISKTSMIRIVKEFREYGILEKFSRGNIIIRDIERLRFVADTGKYE